MRTPAQAAEASRVADAAVVASALIEKLAAGVGERRSAAELSAAMLADIADLADAVRAGRPVAAG